MTSPLRGILWQIGRAQRPWIVLGVTLLAAAALLARVLAGILDDSPHGPALLANAGLILAVPCTFIVLHLMAAFTAIDGELSASGYSRRMFVLPVPTRTLVLGPMAAGGIAVGGAWLLIGGLVLRPTGIVVPLGWPACALAASLLWLQTLSWMPWASDWVRLVVALPLLLALAVAASLVVLFRVPEWIAAVGFLGLLPLAYVACLRSVALARCGVTFDRSSGMFRRKESARPTKARRPFRSAARAQLWFECRCSAWLLVLLTALPMPFFPALILISDRGNVATSWRLLGTILTVPALLAFFLGERYGNVAFPFLATRPVSARFFVRSKLQMALVSAAAAYLPVLLVLPCFLARPGTPATALGVAKAAGVIKTSFWLLLAVAIPIALTWRALAENLWLGLSGRVWLGRAFGLVAMVLVTGGLSLGLYVLAHPELVHVLEKLIPWLVGFLLLLKLLVAACVVGAVVGTGLEGRAGAIRMIGLWCFVVAGLCWLVIGMVPRLPLPVGVTVALVALAVPFSRLAGAPVALAWNRHR